MMLMPSRIAAEAWSQIERIARSRPAPPSAGRNRIGIVRDLKAQAPERPLGVPSERSFSSSSLVRIGVASLIWCADSGVGSSRLRSGPIVVSAAMMISSRMASIGGFVTCAKSCLK